MAFETISLGTQPAGTGGDTARTAFEKVNRNFLAADVLAAAMSQAQFEANRNANKELYAASGWVSFGNHESGKQVNECKPGLYTSLTTPNTLLIGKAGGVGGSKNDNAVLNMAGLLFHIPVGFGIKFSNAPDGKTTYNKSTGVITNHATVAAAFNAQAADPVNVEVVTDRKDMWGFELWLEEVSATNPYVYPNGLVHYQAATMDGIATSSSVRPVTYYAVFDGDTSSKGKGLNYFTLSDANKKKVLSNPKNNLYFLDDGRLVQWRLRQRTIAGAGNGDWYNVNSNSQISSWNHLTFAPLATTIAKGQGSGNIVGSTQYYDALIHPNNTNPTLGVFTARTPTVISVNSECYFLVCGTVNRLSQGAYNPSLNPSGAASWRSATAQFSARKWYQDLLTQPAYTSDCFNFGTAVGTVAGGDIINGANWAGRPDGRHYDAIYADGQGGVCRDMRYSANGIDLVDSAEADQKVKNGTYRGFEKRVFTKLVNHSATTQTPSFVKGTAISFLENFASASPIGKRLRISVVGATGEAAPYNATTIDNLNKVYLVGSNGSIYEFFSVSFYVSGNYGYYGVTSDTNLQTLVSDFDAKFPSGTTITVYRAEVSEKQSVGGSFLQTDVIGNPANILATPQLANGWYGSWIPVIPNGTTKEFGFTRDMILTGMLTYTANNGTSWSAVIGHGTGFDAVKNSKTYLGQAGEVGLHQYRAFATQTESAPNAAIYGLVPYNVFASSDYRPENGALLCESLIGKVLKNNTGVSVNNKSLLSCAMDSTGKLTSASNFDGVTHSPLTLGAPANNSSALKAVSSLANINQQAFIQYAYTELKNNGTNWGDDGKVTIVDNQSTKTDLNGNTVLVGTAKLKEPIGWIKNKV
nr:hypothetical protein [uncultured Shewanella sp.]